jgi:hypothetical protein
MRRLLSVMQEASYNRIMPRRSAPRRPRAARSAAARLAAAERLYRDFEQLTPYPKPRPFVRMFDSFSEYERWRREQRNPWNR